MQQEDLFYEDRFLESWAGAIITNPSTAIVELVANCWDAYATEVKISWPDPKSNKQFSISDNGKGMTKAEFDYIWRAMSYDRIAKGGATTAPPPGVEGLPRFVFGKNGKGRFASFCLTNNYQIASIKDGQKFVYKVSRTPNKPLITELVEFVEKGVDGHGTTITGEGEIRQINLSVEQARELLGGRFLANPSFKVILNEAPISFADISKSSLSIVDVDVPGYGTVKIYHIDTRKADKTTKQHGIAWWVTNRAVGDCKWRGTDVERILDGRTEKAKRFTFIVQADFLNKENAVKEDWSGFHDTNEAWLKTRPIVQDKIKEIISNTSFAEREGKRIAVLERVGESVNLLPLLSKERVTTFVKEVVDTCPNFGEQEVVQLTSILAKLEKSKSQYGLLEILHNQDPNDLDALHEVLSQWTIGMAKVVLDEIQGRLKVINELRIKIQVAGIDEVKELQPLFAKGLWMFGDKFESIHFTSNKGMTTVIRELFDGKAEKASLNRPDFVIRGDGSTGFYSLPSYNEDHEEVGVGHLVIVDLKTTKLSLGSKEKEQIWKYVKELKKKGYIQPETRVDGFVLGDQIESGEGGTRTEDNDKVKIQPLLYSIILSRAEQRLLKLYERVREAPFLLEQQEELSKFVEPVAIAQPSLAEAAGAK
ncbi:histidine kinase-, DNA gyrase B-, and HSP90-like ATPase family protein [Burkholderia pseudomallei MSHR5609]|nr:histidine kinase-, DNA gyrase B-, and HSP90-like ATPase family protein [Burkholderia pseudomallei NAU35A-3]AIV45285.1 histidine kinase-, DNA gyrase B-, and HSP90-like ATPase family protein [Burkholderia pseudomallei TSV 48]KGC27645.1 histidine kinase-, DNA gyrase B-, and HSP90-like ATPase family protein [Burkholderia pseudomallei]KGS59170.1 histidine kinase-, DNA gyrase B-, and HSP90-like ATPase family protein [Burkholderia pseudomallei MSHR5609]KGV27176.1 histidine kinase-, DNA gyrase B-, a